MKQLEGRVAIVTGGAQGLGAAYANWLAENGAKVVIADILDASAVVEEIEAAGGVARNIPTDVAEEDRVKELVATTTEEFGRVDILVNNAAVYSRLPLVKFQDIDVELWDRIMAVNVRGSWLMAKHVAPHMIAREYGKIVNIASGTAYKGQPKLMTHYITSKGAVVSLTRALSRELGEHNICVNTLAPGLILSDSIATNQEHVSHAQDAVLKSRAIQRHGYPKDLLGTMLFLVSDASDFVTGQTIAVDGGSVNT